MWFDCFSVLSFLFPGFLKLQVLVVRNHVSLGAVFFFLDEILHFDQCLQVYLKMK